MSDDDKILALKEAILELLEKDVGDLTPETKFANLDIDSLDAIELQLWLEDNKNMKIEDPTGPIKTVSDFLKLIP